MNDLRLMQEALALAEQARTEGEVPVGAVVALAFRNGQPVRNGSADESARDMTIIGRGYNLREKEQDPMAHAEILALKDAARSIGTWRIENATVAVTLEPCPMCAGALVNARVARVLFGVSDPKAGALGSLYNLGADPRLNHEFDVVPGVLEADCAELLSGFFAGLRSQDG